MTILKSTFEQHHTHNGVMDQSQRDVVFSPSRRLIVEAPAGYGKTKTMVSRIAYLIASNQISSTKKILALTFSVNAAYKIRRDIVDQVKELFENKTAFNLIKNRVEASNYHKFCRRILSLYGYLLHPNFVNISLFQMVNETDNLSPLSVSNAEIEFLRKYENAVKSIGKPGRDAEELKDKLEVRRGAYSTILLEKLVPRSYLTHNGILLLTLHLLDQFPQIIKFYQEFFPIIFVDEFQDTNWLQWRVLQSLVGSDLVSSPDRHLYLLGDRVQRIYGFIGALPDIFDTAKTVYDMDIIKLSTNHRFDINSKLGKIDRVLRANAENLGTPEVPFTIEIPIYKDDTQGETSARVLSITQSLLNDQSNATIAILVRAGLNKSRTTEGIYNALQVAKVDFFFALYGDEDQEYIDFHKNCFDIWVRGIQSGSIRSFKAAQSYMNKEVSLLPVTEVSTSLITLLKLLMDKVQTDYSFFSFSEKASVVTEALANRALKQHLDLVRNSRIVLATSFAAKGLEWDYVILPDVQKFSFPPKGFCSSCSYCDKDWSKRSIYFEKAFLEELSVFYVAVTRARRDVILFYSNNVIHNDGEIAQSRLSCLAKLPGLVPVN